MNSLVLEKIAHNARPTPLRLALQVLLTRLRHLLRIIALPNREHPPKLAILLPNPFLGHAGRPVVLEDRARERVVRLEREVVEVGEGGRGGAGDFGGGGTGGSRAGGDDAVGAEGGVELGVFLCGGRRGVR